MPTKIEWAEESWNPVTGCTPISEGCQNCYARRMAQRLRGRCGYPADEPFRVTLHKNRLMEPLKWKKPKRIFVCSMGDLFHPDVPAEFVVNVFEVIEAAKQHTFLVLTKRPERIDSILYGEEGRWYLGGGDFLPNVWLGVTAENQEQADERIPILLQIPAAVRFVSVEPMLGPVNLRNIYRPQDGSEWDALKGVDTKHQLHLSCKLGWVICGGESGPGARPMHPDWVRSLRDQCKAAGVPFFFKQWGEWRECMPPDQWNSEGYKIIEAHGTHFVKLGKKAAGRLLDGREWNEYPESKEAAR